MNTLYKFFEKNKNLFLIILLILIFVGLIYSKRRHSFSLQEEYPPFHKSDFQTIFSEVKNFAKERNLNAAIEECKKLIKEHEDDKDIVIYAYSLMGNYLSSINSFNEALKSYEEAEKIYSSNPARYKYLFTWIQFYRAKVYSETNRLEEAISTHKSLIEELAVEKEYPTFDINLVMSELKRLFVKRGRAEEFVLYLENLIEKYDGSIIEGSALLELASYYTKQKKYQKALETYNKIKKKFPDDNLLITKAQRGIEDIYRRDPSLKKESPKTKFTPDFSTPDKTFYTYVMAFKIGDFKTMYDCRSRAAKERIEWKTLEEYTAAWQKTREKTSEEEIDKSLKMVEQVKEQFEKRKISSNEFAFKFYLDPEKKQEARITFVKEDGNWKIESWGD